MKERNVPLLYLLSFVVYWRFLFSRSGLPVPARESWISAFCKIILSPSSGEFFEKRVLGYYGILTFPLPKSISNIRFSLLLPEKITRQRNWVTKISRDLSAASVIYFSCLDIVFDVYWSEKEMRRKRRSKGKRVKTKIFRSRQGL